jgi:hypothetical protein
VEDESQESEPPQSARSFKSWNEMASYLMHPKGGDEIYRGQRLAAWKCQTSLQRALLDAGVKDKYPESWDDWEQSALSWFRAYGSGHLVELPDDDDLVSWLVLMQHHGAPTRLLDWTESPFVAVYFAYRDMRPDQAEPAALWRWEAFGARAASSLRFQRSSGDGSWYGTGRDDFHRKYLTVIDETRVGGKAIERRLPRRRDPTWRERELQIVREHIREKRPIPLPILPPRPTPRMISQQTVLTVIGNLATSVEDEIRQGGPTAGRLEKFELPVEWRTGVINSLRLMGLTEAALFPDLDGVGREVSMLVATQTKPARAQFESMWLYQPGDPESPFRDLDKE